MEIYYYEGYYCQVNDQALIVHLVQVSTSIWARATSSPHTFSPRNCDYNL